MNIDLDLKVLDRSKLDVFETSKRQFRNIAGEGQGSIIWGYRQPGTTWSSRYRHLHLFLTRNSKMIQPYTRADLSVICSLSNHSVHFIVISYLISVIPYRLKTLESEGCVCPVNLVSSEYLILCLAHHKYSVLIEQKNENINKVVFY